ncbi:transcriptional regulator NrdR [Candidatus Peregrinibacteria bacterium RIFOXYC2_FULL_33_13]|nr:MAG: Transcriptional repressor NrdR [Candidatus Peregrinibacteria bacterium GW2011_GWA2_33_10]KKP39278.1 MAG: ATP-cone domain-containing protein, transcriptional repressor NrdR [Candidatus Peregrinibacteria bacterium GW2011_GWC2_33_13]OGJ49966.1 MAG: transcriptional regulator NrdR [Candidatus Peregrinibacteria bacterium RIFOXYA2_FULL_33_7]OGJ56923.1 MAG: transcriptional regulator NrdR [Candidatus Peregrinibacteria bacterium RIFOXYC2_FULL_33_13]
MRCPKCRYFDTKVIDSRETNENREIRRRRECLKCNFRFTTFEKLEANNLIVIKKDQTREKYDRQKILKGIWQACEKRLISEAAIEKFIDELEEKWTFERKKEIETQEIGNQVMDFLKKLDNVAYIRFASVYRQFKDIETFKEELQKLTLNN